MYLDLDLMKYNFTIKYPELYVLQLQFCNCNCCNCNNFVTGLASVANSQ